MPQRQRRSHESSSRPPCRPSPGAVEAGRHCGGRSERNGPPRVDIKASKRVEPTDFQSSDHMYLAVLHISIPGSIHLLDHTYQYNTGTYARGTSYKIKSTVPTDGLPPRQTESFLCAPHVLSLFVHPSSCPHQFDTITGRVYPELYESFVSKMSPINLDMGVVLSYSCMITTDFYDHLLVASISPLVALVVLVGSYWVAKKRNHASAPAMLAALQTHQAAAMFVAFFVYSPASYRIFQTFACDELDDGKTYLRADYSLRCSDSRHDWYKAYALIMVGVYPFGTAAVFAWLLGRHRHDLVKPDRDTLVPLKPLSGMWAAYKPSRYFFEVVECGRRIGLTGIAAFVLPYSREQMAIALLFAVVFVFISEAISPFERKADMNLYRWGNGIVVASMYVAFLMKIDVGHETTPAMLAFSGVLIAANVFMVVTVLLQTALLVKEWCGATQTIRAIDVPVSRTAPSPARYTGS